MNSIVLFNNWFLVLCRQWCLETKDINRCWFSILCEDFNVPVLRVLLVVFCLFSFLSMWNTSLIVFRSDDRQVRNTLLLWALVASGQLSISCPIQILQQKYCWPTLTLTTSHTPSSKGFTTIMETTKRFKLSFNFSGGWNTSIKSLFIM